MTEVYLDRLMEYLEGAVADTYQGEQKEKLLRKIIFGGKRVDPVTHNHAVALYQTAQRRMIVGDTVNARTFIYHCAQNMGLLQ